MTDAEREFWKIFWRIKEKYNLQVYTFSSIYENVDKGVDVWWVNEEGKKKYVCREREKHKEDCYKRAIDDLKFYDKLKSEGRYRSA